MDIPSAHVEYVTAFAARNPGKKVIYDIGACTGAWSQLARSLWPDATIIAFEANERMAPLLAHRADKYHIAVLSDQERRRVQWYENLHSPTGDSYYREIATDFYPLDAYRWRETQTLDAVVRRRGFPPPDLVKIDVQGAELDVIRGGIDALRHARDFIIELQHSQYNDGAAMVDVSLPAIERMLNVRCERELFCNNGPDGDYHFVIKKEYKSPRLEEAQR